MEATIVVAGEEDFEVEASVENSGLEAAIDEPGVASGRCGYCPFGGWGGSWNDGRCS